MSRVAGRAVIWIGLAGAAFASGIALPAAQKTALPAAARLLTLPLSVADIMRASIEIPADGIWAAEGADKLAEEDWQLADQDAVNLIAATTLLAGGGTTGGSDGKWAANTDWQSWVRDMQKTAVQIRGAVKATDQKKMSAAADHLQEICEACHTKYRPQTPSDGVTRYPFYPKRELVK